MMRAAREEAAAARMARLYPTAPEVRVSVRVGGKGAVGVGMSVSLAQTHKHTNA